MRILGLDVGDKRIGMALCDELGCTAQPLELYERKGPRQDIAYLKGLAERLGVQEIVVGMPYKMSGGMSSIGQRIGDFVNAFKASCAIPVVLCDERLSTVQATRAMLEGDLSRRKRKAKVDVMAAQLILQSYLESKRIARERQEEKERWSDLA